MKSEFLEYYNLTTEEINDLWERALIIFDTNVLLNWYRYSYGTIEEFNKLLNKIQARLWLPHQIALEFHRDRISVISQQIKVYNDFESKLANLELDLSNKSKNPFLPEDLFEEVISVFKKVNKQLSKTKNNFENSLTEDKTLDFLTTLFDKKVGSPFPDKQLQEIKNNGAQRFKNKTPPGYLDNDKPESERYGDYIIWEQIIEHTSQSKLPVIFVTDDKKDDWWFNKEGRTIGARPELRKEFLEKTQQRIYLYNSFRFLEHANKFLQLHVNNSVIQEVKDSSSEAKNSFTDGNYLVTISCKKDQENAPIQSFQKLLEASGYDVDLQLHEKNYWEFIIRLPFIEDLLRRLKSKFVPLMANYNLTFIDFTYVIISSS